jgi:hypothetical protein
MIEQGLFKRYFVGRDGFLWWIGQVAPESSWKDNKPGSPVGTNDDIKGFGERYRVRIMGYHTADIDKIPDDELPWAYVMYPVTAGTGGRSSSQSANISQGDFVFGFFMDGEDAQMPVIMGLLGNNEYAAVSKNITKARFVPFSGYTENDKVTYTSLNTDKGGEVVKQTGPQTEGPAQSQGDNAGTPNNPTVNESATQSTSKTDAATEASGEENTEALAQPSDCEPIPMGKIQKDIQNVITDIQKAQKSIYKYSQAVKSDISDIQTYINGKLQVASQKVAEGIKWVFKEIQKFVTNKVNNTMKNTYYLLFPNERPTLKKAVDTVNDLIACLFRKFVGLLLGQIGAFLQDAANKVINGARCIVENLIANTLGQIIGELSREINKILSSITSLVGQAASIAGDVLGLLVDILSFLTCEEKPDCSSVNQWNILSGPQPISKSDIDSIIGKAKNFASGVENLTDPDNFSFNTDFSDVFSLDACNIGPVLCGPPVAQFFGAETGTGALGNLIISAAGEVIGIDMVSFGIGYDKTKTYGNVFDACGKGKGAVIRPVVEDYEDDDGNIQTGVVDIIIDDPGKGYLSAPDGSKGGNEYTWSDPDDTIVKHPDGSYDTPKPPGNIIDVNPGDEVTLPPGTVIVTEPQPGEEEVIGRPGDDDDGDIIIDDGSGGDRGPGQGGGEEIIGGTPIVITKPGKFTSPRPDFSRTSGIYPSSSTGSYPVILYLCEIIIDNPGINYSPGDKIIIEPDIGAKAEPKFDTQGRVISIKVTEGGEGFTEYPRIYIQSETGYNAVLRPKLCIDRVGSDELKEPTTQDKVITVIDCVGKV